MHRRDCCHFDWVYLFGDKHVVAYKPGQLVQATQSENGQQLHRLTGTNGMSVKCLHAFLQGSTCQVHKHITGPAGAKADDPALQEQMMACVMQPYADTQNVALEVLATMQLSEQTKDAFIQYLLKMWLKNEWVNRNLLYFVHAHVQVKPGWVSKFIDTWARTAQTFVCDACSEGDVSCVLLHTARPDMASPVPAKLSMQAVVSLRCNMCGGTTRTAISIPSFQFHHYYLSPRRTRRKAAVRRRPQPLVATLS